jgi:predicted nucleic acid-binding protein
LPGRIALKDPEPIRNRHAIGQGFWRSTGNWRTRKDQSTDYTEAVLGSLIAGAEAIVPAIWKLELANALVVAERRKKIAPEKSARFLRDLQQFAISIGLEYVFATVLEHARLYHRSAYDASYLELAQPKSSAGNEGRTSLASRQDTWNFGFPTLILPDNRCHLPKPEKNGKQMIFEILGRIPNRYRHRSFSRPNAEGGGERGPAAIGR